MNRLYPYVSGSFFIIVAILTLLCRHPLFLGISLIFAFISSLIEGGRKALKFNLLYLIPVILLTALINPLFNHRGVTVLARFPSGNPLTLESLIYGIFAGIMLGAIVAWFTYHNKVMTSDKICFIFGRFAPSLSILFSLTLRFIPLMSNKLKRIIISRKCLSSKADKEQQSEKTSVRTKVKEVLKILSIMVDRGLETAITTSDSMKCRGYGYAKRSFFSIFKFSRIDGIVLAIFLGLLVYISVGAITGCLDFQYYPEIIYPDITPYSFSVFIAFILLCAMPLLLRKYENKNKQPYI